MSQRTDAADFTLDSQMIGYWVGEREVIVTWRKQKKLAVKVTIQKDGTVSGTIGDAALAKGA